MSKPVAVVISDVHFTLNTLEVATAAFKQAISKAAELRVPLIDCGDLTNDKALLRAEVVNRLLDLGVWAFNRHVRVYSIVGNHSLLNEKTAGEHALRFLSSGYWHPISTPCTIGQYNFIPYQPNTDDFYKAIQEFPHLTNVFTHQGMQGGAMGDYIQDHSAVDPKRLKDWRIFTGHYHKHYELENTVSVGNPYTLTFGEANDPPKGFLVVYDDGSFERVLTKLRKHIVVDLTVEPGANIGAQVPSWNTDDLLWLKLRGTPSVLATHTKESIGKVVAITAFKLDKIPTETPGEISAPEVKQTAAEVIDGLVDALSDSAEHKVELKRLWREVSA